MYTITVHNEQGASEQHNADSIESCQAWLGDTWSDVENLKAVITHGRNEVAVKPMGTTVWYDSMDAYYADTAAND